LRHRHFNSISMFRYYMTSETRQAVIAESNRLIAHRAAMNASRSPYQTGFGGEPVEDDAFVSNSGMEAGEADSGSAFARLVADLQSSAGTSFSAVPSATHR
jgi:hypothetical protein